MYQGIAVFQERNSTAAISLSGSGNVNITGTVYAASAAIKLSGNGNLNLNGNAPSGLAGHLIAADLLDSGNGSVLVDVSASAQFAAAAVDHYFASYS